MATRKPRILSVQPTSDGGGSETALIGMLGELTAAGWECHVALPRFRDQAGHSLPPRLAERYRAAGALVHVVDMRRLTTSGGKGYWLAYAAGWGPRVAQLSWLIRRLGVDVVHSNSLHCLHGWAAAAVTRRPHIWHAREIVTQSAQALRLERQLARRFASQVLAISQPVADQLDPGNVVVVHDAPDTARFNPARAGSFRAAEGIPPTTLLVGSAARLDTWKGFGVLLEAWERVREREPEWQLVIAGAEVQGKEAYARRLEQRAAEIGGVRLLGGRDDLPQVLADLDLFVQVSTTPEPWGMVLVEALASGVPVIAGNQGGPVEIAQLAAPGVVTLVDPGDPAALAEAILAAVSGPGAHPSPAVRESLWAAPPADWSATLLTYTGIGSQPGP